jgi:hypothetical protein
MKLRETSTRQRVTLPVNDDDCQHPTPGSVFLRRNLSEHVPEGGGLAAKVDRLDLGDEILGAG